MAAKKALNTSAWTAKPRKKRPGVHAKTKRSFSKKSRNWSKAYRGQGR